MELNEKILEELIKIRKLLTIFSQDKLDAFNLAIKQKYLTTPEREQMYDMFDGTMGLKEISEKVKVSAEGARVFAVALEKAGLLEYVAVNGKLRYPKKIF